MNQINRSLLLRSAVPLQDNHIEGLLESISLRGLRRWVDDEKTTAEFIESSLAWISPFLGDNNFATFASRALTSGTSGAFQDFYQINQGRRLRILKGEYPFHRDVFGSLNLPWDWITEVSSLQKDDFVIMSYPFSGDGEKTPLMESILQACERLQIPVLIDCAFAGLSDLVLPQVSSFQCVKKVAFSFSKLLNFGAFRCGFELSRYDSGANFILNKWDYGPKASAFMVAQVLEKVPMDFIRAQYRTRQLEVCQSLSLRPSSSVLFGIGDEHWTAFSRDGYANRVCLSEVLTQK